MSESDEIRAVQRVAVSVRACSGRRDEVKECSVSGVRLPSVVEQAESLGKQYKLQVYPNTNYLSNCDLGEGRAEGDMDGASMNRFRNNRCNVQNRDRKACTTLGKTDSSHLARRRKSSRPLVVLAHLARGRNEHPESDWA